MIYRHLPERAVLVARPLILLDLALALHVSGAASGRWRSVGQAPVQVMGAFIVGGTVMALGLHRG